MSEGDPAGGPPRPDGTQPEGQPSAGPEVASEQPGAAAGGELAADGTPATDPQAEGPPDAPDLEVPLDKAVTGEFGVDPLDETRATEALADRRRLQRRARRSKLKGYVVVRRAGAPPARVAMDRPILSFGRDADECDIVLEGTGISRRHALIERDVAGYFMLMDCKSRNGTFVDGQPVTTMNLLDGDVFEIGEHRIEFHAE